MKGRLGHRFHKGLRVRIGAIFSGLILLCVLVAGGFVYRFVARQLERSFRDKLLAGAHAVLAKTETAPLIVPLPDSGDYFLLTYRSVARADTLFDNLPAALADSAAVFRSVRLRRTTDEGAVLAIVYAQRASGLNADLARIRLLLFLYMPLVLLLAFPVAYFLSGFVLRPLASIIRQANGIRLQEKAQLLALPNTGDELAELAETLNAMLLRIQDQADQQNAFFAAAAHELRTPLSTMLTELQVMAASETDAALLRFVQSQTAEVQRLKNLVNGFLLLSQLKAGALPVTKTAVSLLEVCTDVLERLDGRAATAGRFRLEALPPEGDFTATADAGHLAIVVGNLLENALKYSLPGSVIAVTVLDGADGLRLRIRNAVGQAVDITHLIRAFTRRTDVAEGFGLGLWISAQLCRLNGAELRLESATNWFAATVWLPTDLLRNDP